MKLFFALISLVPFAACGSDDPLAPGAGNDPGSGTNTLHVDGRASAEPNIPGAKKDVDFTTDFSIRLQLNGNDVTTGTVTMKTRFATTTLTFGGNNRWEGRASAYDEVYQLDVIAGADEIKGLIVDGPDIHTITAPAAGASLDSTIANDLKWDRDSRADIATLDAENIDHLTIDDSGTYSMPPGSLKAEKDQTKENTIELTRTNRVVPAGATADSELSVSIQQRVDVLALPNPAL